MAVSINTNKLNFGRWSAVSPAMILVAIAAVAFYVLNLLSPEYHDDFIYKFMIAAGAVDYSRPISSIGDIIRSQVNHYSAVNGRSIVHFLVQLFTGLLGKQLFNVVNVLMFTMFVCLLKRYAAGRNQRGNLLLYLVTLALILFLPRFKDTFLWMTGSVNYLWSATATLIFLHIYESRRQRLIGWQDFWLLPVAVLLGWTHEGITLPLGVALFVLNVLHFKKTHNTEGICLSVAFFAGACLAAFAPGTMARSGMDGGLSASALGLKIINGFMILGKLKVVYLAILLCVASAIWSPLALKKVVNGNLHLLLAALLSLGIVFLSGLTSARTAFGLELFALLFAMRLIWELMNLLSGRTVKYASIVLGVAIALFYGLWLRHAALSWQEAQRLKAQIENTRDGIIATNEHDAGLFSSFVPTMISNDASAAAVNYDPKSWPLSMAKVYHCDSLVFLPQPFLDDLKTHPVHYQTINMDSPFEFFVAGITDDEVVEEVRFNLFPTDFDELPFFFRPIARKMNRYNDTVKVSDKWSAVTLYGNRYVIIKKDHDLLNRMKEICIIKKSGSGTENQKR